MTPRFIFGACCLLLSLVALAGRVDSVDVQHQSGRYSAVISSWVALPQPQLRAVLMDYERVITANDAIESVTVLPAPRDDVTRLQAEVEVCVWFFCKRLTQTQDMELLGAGLLQATIIPALSDFKSGHAEWRMISEGEGSRLLFAFEVEPDFWVPPLIGPLLIKRKMRAEAVATVAGIESLAAAP